MICNKCNASIPDDSSFCPACGSPIERHEEQQAYIPIQTVQPTYIPVQPTMPPQMMTSYAPVPVNENSKMNWAAITGFILSLIALCSFWLGLIPFIFAVTGLIFSILGAKSDKKGLAIAGIVISVVAMVIAVAVVFLALGTFRYLTNNPDIFSGYADEFERAFDEFEDAFDGLRLPVLFK